jgi:transcriptional regulator with PAS, ATPase and Fis domain
MLDPHESCIDWQHLPDDIALEMTPTQPVSPKRAVEPSHNLQELSHGVIRQALESSCGNMSQAARRLGISRQTLYRKLRD